MNSAVNEFILAQPNWDRLGPTFVDAIGDTLSLIHI